MIFFCGWPLPLFASWLFNTTSVRDWSSDCMAAQKQDILVLGIEGPCSCDLRSFPGTTLAVNGESRVPKSRNMPSEAVVTGAHGLPFPYGAVEWINQNYTVFRGDISTFAVAYVNSNCVQVREDMVKNLSRIVEVHAYGKCTGNGTAIRKSFKDRHWTSVHNIYRGYAFAIGAEHGMTRNYVTEKPFAISASGAIPIVLGDPLVYKYLNIKRLLTWGTQSPETVVSEFLSNPSKLQAKRSLPVLNEDAFEEGRNMLRERLHRASRDRLSVLRY